MKMLCFCVVFSLWLIIYLSLTKIGVLQCAPRCIWLWIWFLHMTLWRKMCFKSFIKGHIVSMMSALSVGHVSTSQQSGVVYGIHRWSTMTSKFSYNTVRLLRYDPQKSSTGHYNSSFTQKSNWFPDHFFLSPFCNSVSTSAGSLILSLDLIPGTFVTSDLSEKHIICSLFLWIYEKIWAISQFHRHKIVFEKSYYPKNVTYLCIVVYLKF